MAKEDKPTHVMISHDEWTLETLRIYLEATIHNLSILLDERNNSAEKRYEILTQTDTRLQAQAITHMTREEYAAAHLRLQTQVNELGEQLTKYVTTAENDALHARTDDQIGELKERMNRTEGKAAGYLQSWLFLVAAISTVGVIVGIFVYFAEH